MVDLATDKQVYTLMQAGYKAHEVKRWTKAKAGYVIGHLPQGGMVRTEGGAKAVSKAPVKTAKPLALVMENMPQCVPVLTRSEGVWSVTIPCPFCGQRHEYQALPQNAASLFGFQKTKCELGPLDIYIQPQP